MINGVDPLVMERTVEDRYQRMLDLEVCLSTRWVSCFDAVLNVGEELFIWILKEVIVDLSDLKQMKQ